MFRFACQKSLQRHSVCFNTIQSTPRKLFSTSQLKSPVLGSIGQSQTLYQAKVDYFTSKLYKRNLSTFTATESTINQPTEPKELSTFWSRATELTNSEKDWNVSEEDAQKPKILFSFLFFIAAGLSTFTWAAYMTIEDNKKTAQITVNQKEIGTELSEERPNRLKGIVKAFSGESPLAESGEEDIFWGDLDEAHLRKARKEQKIGLMMDKYSVGLLKIQDHLDKHTITNEILRNILSFPIYLYASYNAWTSTRLPDEKLAALPICASMVSIALGLRLGKAGYLGKHINGFLRNHMMRTPAAAANRLHTFAISPFSHIRLADALKYSTVMLFFGSSYLELPKVSKDGMRIHTAEATTFYHFLAFCIAAGTFANVSSQVFFRLLLQRVNQRYGSQIGTKLIGRKVELGAGGIAGGLIGNYLYHYPIWTRGRDVKNDRLTSQESLSCGCGLLIIFEAGVLTLGFIDRRYLGGIDRAARLGGTLFGYMYGRYGNAFWESMKRFFYDGEEQLLIDLTESTQQLSVDQLEVSLG